MKRWCVVASCLLVVGCKRPSTGGDDTLTREVLDNLAAREAKLQRYRLAGRSDRPGEPPLSFEFSYRAPGRMQGRLFAPEEHVLSFDGEVVYEVLPGQKMFRTLTLPKSASERALRVSERFVPFVPEGLRTPLLPWQSTHAALVSHPRAPEAVALKANLTDASGAPLTVTYTLRWPSMDFLVKRVEGAGGVAELRLDEEQCEERLALCIPLRLSQFKGGNRVGGTQVVELELFRAPDAEAYTLRPPPGFAEEKGNL